MEEMNSFYCVTLAWWINCRKLCGCTRSRLRYKNRTTSGWRCKVILILIIKPTRCTDFSNLFLEAVSKPVWHIPLLCVQWKTPDDGQRNCPKHVELYSENKFEKWVRLVGFIIRIYHDARSPEGQMCKVMWSSPALCWTTGFIDLLHTIVTENMLCSILFLIFFPMCLFEFSRWSICVVKA